MPGEGNLSIRLFVASGLAGGAEIALPDRAAHYLVTVMRRRPGDEIRLFNAVDGEWSARLGAVGRKHATAIVAERIRAPRPEPDLWLMFAPPKGARQDLIVEKGTELGVARFQPTQVLRSVVDRVNVDRLGAIAVEAAEQCERLGVPVIEPMRSLDERLGAWPAGRRLILCDETGGPPLVDFLLAERARPKSSSESSSESSRPTSSWAILVGPEGGFAPAELDALGKLAFVVRTSLGPRILRAETAAMIAVGLWQYFLGDGSAMPEPRASLAPCARASPPQRDS